MSDPSLVRFRVALEGALAHLESRRQEINDLNVFPVADGDTGDNMALTLQACLEEVDRLAQVDRPLDEIRRDEIVESVARAALLGARGNSGVILSQLIRGAAEELVSRPGELIDPVLLGAAMARAAQRAYASVRAPAEGTMLTVMRDMAAHVASRLAHDAPRLGRVGPESEGDEQERVLADILEEAIVAGEASVRRGPELLPVLREAGVVDAGGYGVIVIFAGVVAALRGEAAPALAHHAPARISHPEHDSSTYRYCTNFAVTGGQLDAARYVGALEELGDSVLVVGDHTTLKVHVHTDDPETAIAVFAGVGQVSHLDVADMRAQVAQRDARLTTNGHSAGARTGVLAVVSGAGMARLYESLGAHVLDGGPTLNPSTHELLAGIHAVPSEEVVVLPNSANVIMAAERAAELAEKAVRVVVSTSQQAGLAAAVALSPDADADTNAGAMRVAIAAVRTGAVAPAARDDAAGRFGVGDAVGFVDDELVAWGATAPTLEAVLAALAADAELVTCIAGEGAPLDGEAIAALTPVGVELELEDGGQPSYWWLLSAE